MLECFLKPPALSASYSGLSMARVAENVRLVYTGCAIALSDKLTSTVDTNAKRN
jgi:hypothetical protein